MPNSITKNKKDEKTIERIFKKAFPDKQIKQVQELSEGFFNVAYHITMVDHTEVILKIAPSAEMDIMTHEINIMYSEVDCMKKVAKETAIPVAEILYYDNSHTICDSDYMFMKKLKGRSFHSCMDAMSEEQKEQIFRKMGEYTAVINCIKGSKFGYYGQPDKQGDQWFYVFRDMIKDTYYDAGRKNIEIKVPRDKLLYLLDQDRERFEQVKEPKLVHWDIWAGNVFVCDNEITGLIDFERCLWGDELLEVGFRTCWYGKAFFDGYGLDKLNKDQLRRAMWYDIYLFLISCLECDYRCYDDKGAYEWGSKMLLDWVEKLEANDV